MFTHKIIESLNGHIESYKALLSVPEHVRQAAYEAASIDHAKNYPQSPIPPYKYLDLGRMVAEIKKLIPILSAGHTFYMPETLPQSELEKLVRTMRADELRLPYPVTTLLVDVKGLPKAALIARQEQTSVLVSIVLQDVRTDGFEIQNGVAVITLGTGERITTHVVPQPFAEKLTEPEFSVVMDHTTEASFAYAFYFLGFLGLLNCSNIEPSHVTPPIKLNKKRTAKGKPPITGYSILNLRHERQGTHTSGSQNNNPSTSGTGHRLHLRRGHFQNYHTGKGRKKTIRKWVQPYLAGDAQKGTKNKDYKLHL